MLEKLSRTVVVTGHYGSGKTNLSINMALALKEMGREVTLCDLDVVNPYFRSADFRSLATERGIHLVTPGYAGSSLDIPSLTGELDARLGGGDTVIIDVGGDDDGAHALGRYAPRIKALGAYDMLFVVSFYRYLTRSPQEAAAVLESIEAASRLRVTAIVNNSNLSAQTTAQDITASIEKARELAELTGRPLAFSSVNRALAETLSLPGLLPVDVHVKTPWQT